MYRILDIQGNGIVNDSCNCDPNIANLNLNNTKIIPGSLGVQSGCCPLPDSCGNLYKVGNSYQVMKEQPQDINFLNNLGLYAMPDYKIMKKCNGGNGYFYGSDGRVVDAARDIRMVLDAPAKVGAVNMDMTAYINNKDYGGIYNTYSDLNNGQIAYYVDSSISQPFFEPVYTLSSYVDKTIRVDPMDSPKPEYIKTPISTTLNSVSKDQATRDQLSFREDLMSRQQNLYNRTSWTNRWIKG
jgi:hypothetical protein